MSSHHYSTTYGHGSNRSHIHHGTTMPCLCPDCQHASSLYASNPVITHWYNNVPTNSANLLTYQGALQNPVSGSNPLVHVENDHEASEQMTTNEIDSWLLLNPDINGDQDQNNLSSHQTDHGFLNLTSYMTPWTGNQYQGLLPQDIQQVINYNQNYGMVSDEQQQEPIVLNFSQGFQHDFSRAAAFNNTPAIFLNASLPATASGIVPEAAIGSFSNTMDLPGEWALNQLSFLPFHPGNLIDETVGSHSNSSSIPSEGTQQQTSRDASQIPIPPMSCRQERVQRYFEKKKARKYEKKIQYSSRRTYAQTRPRVRGRFISSSQTNAQ